MAAKPREVSKELEDEIRALSLSSVTKQLDDNGINENLPVSELEEKPILTAPTKPLPAHKRIVTVEYLDKFEKATAAAARYEAIKDFSQMLSNLSMILLAISIIICLIIYFIDSQMLSSIALLGLLLEAAALLSITLYSIAKTTTLKQVSELAASDLSTCTHIIGNPRSETTPPTQGVILAHSKPKTHV